MTNTPPPKAPAAPKKLGKILFVFDERLSRQKTTALTRLVNVIRQIAEVRLISGNINEDGLLAEMEKTVPSLVILPWYRYLSWSRVEGFYGLTRNNGPTCLGFHFGQLLPYELGEQADHLRTILLDFCGSTPAEVLLLIRALLTDKTRSGLVPLVGSKKTIYVDNWFEGQGLGLRMDAVLALPEIARTHWAQRGGTIRVTLGALWSLIYDEGPGKGELSQQLTGDVPKGYLQVAVGDQILAMRLIYKQSSWSPKDVLQAFWPDKVHPTAPSQLLLRHADLLRIHHITDANDIEVVVGLFKSAVAERHPEEIHTLWIEPLHPSLVLEPPLAEPGPENPLLKPLPLPLPEGISGANARHTPGNPSPEQNPAVQALIQARDRQIQDLTQQVLDLRDQLAEKDEQVQELRSGGVGTAPEMAPPDAESLLEAFQERFLDARFQLRGFELRYGAVEKKGGTLEDIRALREKMVTLAKRQEGWIRTMAEIIKIFQEDRRNKNKAA